MTRTFRLGSILTAAVLLTIGTSPADGASQTERPNFTGTWQLNEELSENPREKMREAMRNQGRSGGGGRGGGRGGGGFGGRGGGGRPGGGSRDAPTSVEAMQEQMRVMQERVVLLEISHTEPTFQIRYGDASEELFYTDGRPFDRTIGGGEIVEAAGQWKGKERLIVARGQQMEVTETWELVPDADQLWITVKTEGDGRRPSFEYRRIYDPVESDPGSIDVEADKPTETSGASN